MEINQNQLTIKQFIKKLADREGVSVKKIETLIKKAFNQSYLKNENRDAKLVFDFSNELTVYRVFDLVDKVINSVVEVSKDNQELLSRGVIKEDNKLYILLDVKGFSVALNQEIYKQLHNEVKIIRANKQDKQVKNLKGKIIKGKVYSFIDNNNCLIESEGMFGIWDKRENNKKPVYFNQTMLFLVKEQDGEENNSSSNPNLLLTRSGELFFRKIMEMEIPEIKYGIINIKNILYVPNVLAKVIVESNRKNVDAVGTCIGKGAERIRNICRNTQPVRMEVVNWSENRKDLLCNLLLPVKVISVLEKPEIIEVVVPQEKASLLLDNKGKTIEEISTFFNKKVHLKIFDNSSSNDDENNIFVWNGNLSIKDFNNLD